MECHEAGCGAAESGIGGKRVTGHRVGARSLFSVLEKETDVRHLMGTLEVSLGTRHETHRPKALATTGCISAAASRS